MNKAFEAKTDSKIIINAVIERINYANSLLLGYSNDLLSKDDLPKYIELMSENIEILYDFSATLNDIHLMEEAKRIVALIYQLLLFISDDFKGGPESPLFNVVSLMALVQAKIKLHSEITVTVNDLALLADITTMGVIQAIKRKQLKANKIGNIWTILSSDALKWLEKRC